MAEDVEQVKQTSVAFGKTEIDIINNFSQRTGVKNFSATLRMIVRSWDQQNKAQGAEFWKPEDLSKLEG